MRASCFFLLLVLLSGCTENREQKTGGNSRFQHLLSFFKDIQFDTLQVYSSENNYADSFPFKGIALDSASVSLLSKITADYATGDAFFACFRFPLDANRIGLIMRTPSAYESSSIKLLVFDASRDSITSSVELSELVGDAGAVYSKRSWLYKDRGGVYHINGLVEESYDRSVENENDTTVEHSSSSYRLALSGRGFDTVKPVRATGP